MEAIHNWVGRIYATFTVVCQINQSYLVGSIIHFHTLNQNEYWWDFFQIDNAGLSEGLKIWGGGDHSTMLGMICPPGLTDLPKTFTDALSASHFNLPLHDYFTRILHILLHLGEVKIFKI